MGDVQAAKPAASRSHSNVAPVSGDVNVKLALVEFVALAGAAEIVVSGGVVSTVQVNIAGVASLLPALSTA